MGLQEDLEIQGYAAAIEACAAALRHCTGSEHSDSWVQGGGSWEWDFQCGERFLMGVTFLSLGQCSVLTVCSTPAPQQPIAILATTAIFFGVRMPGILTLMFCCLPSLHGHPCLKVRAFG